LDSRLALDISTRWVTTAEAEVQPEVEATSTAGGSISGWIPVSAGMTPGGVGSAGMGSGRARLENG